MRALDVEAHLVRQWRTAASAATYIDSIFTHLHDLHGVEMSDNVWVVVSRCGNFVEQLRLHRAPLEMKVRRCQDAW